MGVHLPSGAHLRSITGGMSLFAVKSGDGRRSGDFGRFLRMLVKRNAQLTHNVFQEARFWRIIQAQKCFFYILDSLRARSKLRSKHPTNVFFSKNLRTFVGSRIYFVPVNHV